MDAKFGEEGSFLNIWCSSCGEFFRVGFGSMWIGTWIWFYLFFMWFFVADGNNK